MPYTFKSYTHHTRAPDVGQKEKKKQGMNVFFTYTHHKYSPGRSKDHPSLSPTSVSICSPYIFISYTHYTRPSDLGPMEKLKQGLYVLLLIHIIRTLQAEARTSLLLGLPLSQYVCPISLNHIRTIRGLQT